MSSTSDDVSPKWIQRPAGPAEALDGPTEADLEAIRAATFPVEAVQERERVTDHVVAAHTPLPVIGVPLTSSRSVAGGLDALLSIAQMPPGVPVACVGVDNARNAAALAARILS